MVVAIIDYGVGNLKSISKFIEMAADWAGVSVKIEITCNPKTILSSDKVIMPGVGCYPDCWNKLQQIEGLMDALNHVAAAQHKQVLGICVGMQLMGSISLELRKTNGLNWIPGIITRLLPLNNLRIPHIGWNVIEVIGDHYLFTGLPLGQAGHGAYFAHSYHFTVVNKCDLLATTPYGNSIAAIIVRNNLVGVQFHPEKSHTLGLMFLRNFITWETSKN
ncbi:MAG: imidazole glycerol phosphate synthase subunit HisH [Candidatus Hodgkinia cicadicola]